ncbi:MAG: bifunctional UDP-N-acetylglucosamine diphosphorylase/glucosamine-1-phosphate N-acetyltransferase GlmU, partial [Nitrospirota bacterium]
RIIRDGMGKVTGIVEDKHASPEEKKMFKELNGGVYVMESDILGHLGKISRNKASGEYYLTDIIGIVSGAGRRLDAYQCSSEEIRGVNSREELYEISTILKRRVIAGWMRQGVTFIDPETTYVHVSAKIGKDTVIYPNTYIEGCTVIGRQCTVFPGSRIIDSILGNSVIIKDNSLIEKSMIKDGASIGPCAHLRPDSIIGPNARIGNFVEVKKSRIGAGTKAGHLTYLGDADIGPEVNIGAGTITCNYDGKNKFKTVIEAGVFIGSDSQLVAPVTIHKGAYVAAGSTVTMDVPSRSLAISRGRQKNLEDWTIKRKGIKSKESGNGSKKKG